MRISTKSLALAAAPLLLSVAIAGAPARAAEYGSYDLRPGQASLFQIGSTYRWLRVCNDFNSAGPVAATIGDHEARTLQPGICTENDGDMLLVQNNGGGPASGSYQYVRAYDKPH
jgi:hypothetical protein